MVSSGAAFLATEAVGRMGNNQYKGLISQRPSRPSRHPRGALPPLSRLPALLHRDSPPPFFMLFFDNIPASDSGHQLLQWFSTGSRSVPNSPSPLGALVISEGSFGCHDLGGDEFFWFLKHSFLNRRLCPHVRPRNGLCRL